MSVASQPLGRRERNKQAKLERITAAASELFALHGVDEVTTQQIADAADIGAGTLFLYARTKGELLLLVQNAHYAGALERGRAAAASATDALDGVMAVIAEIVECNRTQVDNGRLYLREMVFGDATEPHRAEALAIVASTEQVIAEILVRLAGRESGEAAVLARVLSAVMFVTLAASEGARSSTAELLEAIRAQAAVVLGR